VPVVPPLFSTGDVMSEKPSMASAFGVTIVSPRVLGDRSILNCDSGMSNTKPRASPRKASAVAWKPCLSAALAGQKGAEGHLI